MRRSAAFTLVELLVVISIIVILIALLAPSLDRAIYEATLLRCAANYKAGVSGGMQYAFNNARHYPTRGTTGAHLSNWVRVINQYDVIADLRPYIGLATFYDPLSEPIDLSEGANEPATILLATNAWLYDWARPGWDGVQRHIRRIGDRLVYDPIEDRGHIRTFSVLVGDFDVFAQGNGGVIFEHEDPGSLAIRQRFQNQTYLTGGINLPVLDKITLFWWISGQGVDRGPLDFNYGYADGSVLRLNQVGISDPTFPTRYPDERVWGVIASPDVANRQQQLPRE